jgi:hypothetical protein
MNHRRLINDLRAASHDERLSTGALYRQAADALDSLLGTTSHDWTGPDHVNRHVHCSRCGKIFEVLKAKGVCNGKSEKKDPLP